MMNGRVSKRRLFPVPVILCLAAFLMSLTTTVAFADDQPASAQNQPVRVKITLTTAPQKDGKVAVTAIATKPDSSSASDLALNFVVVPEFFGKKRPVSIGSAKTDTTGTAGISYTPTWDGPHHFEASSDRSAAYAPAQAAVDVQLKAATAPYKSAPPALASLRRSALLGALVVTVGVWLLLIMVVVRVITGLVSGKAEAPSRAQESTAD